MSSVLEITESRSGGVCVLGLNGRIDSTNAEDVMERLQEAIAAGETAVLVDFAAVRYLTSAGFRVLIIAHRRAESRSVRFALCNLIGHVRDLFEMGGLLDVFVVHGSRDEAVARLS